MMRPVVASWMLAMLAMLAVLAGSSGAAPFEKSGIGDWTKPPAAGPEPVFKSPVASRSRLGNGISVLVIENHTLPLAAIEILVPGAGAAADPKQRGGLAAFTADLLDEGAGGLSAIALAEEQRRLGARITTHVDADAGWLSASALARTVEPTLDLVAKVITQPAFAASDFARVKGDRITELNQRRDRPREVASNVLSEGLFGQGSGYGHPETGVVVDVEAITVAELQAFYRDHWSPAAMTIVVVGDVDPRAVTARLEATLGAWHAAAAKAPARPIATPPSPATRLLLVDRPGAAQSDVRIGTIGPNRNDPRFYAFEVLRNIVGGGFTGRVTQRLREQLGIVYHAYTDMNWRVAPGPFVIAAGIVTPETATGISEVFKILDDLATNDAPAAELDKAKLNLVRALPAKFQTNAATAATFAELALLHLPDDWFAGFADGIRRVAAADVKAAGKAILPSGKMSVSIVGDLAKIRPAIDKLGLGTAARYGLDGIALPATAPAKK
jgi:zinc protease